MTSKRVNRIVAIAFIENPNNLPQVNHKDGNKQNNRVDNLEWCNCKYNINEAWRMGLREKRFGKDNKRSRKVNQYDKDGNFIKSWDSIKEAAIELKMHTQNIIACCQGRYATSHGYIWKYVVEKENKDDN